MEEKKKKEQEKISSQPFYEQYFITILEIIEDKPNFLIPIPFYCIIIVVYYCQICGYILSHYESKPLKEELFGYVAYLNEVSPITFLLYMKGLDALTLLCYFFMQFIVYFYFSYVGVLSILKNKFPHIVQKFNRQFQMINQVLNIFFTFFWWMFFTPYIEINSGMIVCGDNSFLVEYRDIENGTSCNKPLYFYIFGIVGLVLSNITGFIIIYFFRNYEFCEGNYLKRRYKFLLVLQLITRFMNTFFYYLNLGIVLYFKHVAVQLLGLSFTYDILKNFPFQQMKIFKFYSVATIFFWLTVTLVGIWIFTDEFPDTQLFYPFAILGVILSGGFLSIINYKFRNIMNMDNETFPKYYKHMDFYLEEIQRLIQMQSRDEQCKFQLFVLLQHHKQWCTNEKCACQIVTFISQNNDINEEEVYKLIDSLFLWALKHPLIKNNNEEFEHLSLKYISYIGKYRNNPYRAYYELKSLLSNRNNVSFYFKTISRILSKNLEFMIDQKYSHDADSRGDSQYLNTDLLLKLQNIKSRFIPLFAEYMKMKHEFWEKTKNGYITMDKFMEQCLILSKKGVSIKKVFEKFQNEVQSQNLITLRIKSIYNCIVVKDLFQAWKDEQQISEIIKRDMAIEQGKINNYSLAEGKVVNLVVSLSKQRGRILTKKTPQISKYFGYTQHSFKQIKNIQQLMPDYIGQNHNEFMMNFVYRGQSMFIKKRVEMYYKDQDQFLNPIYIYLDHIYQQPSDFCINASILKYESNDNTIMFDQYGNIFGIDEELFNIIFKNKTTVQSENSKKFISTVINSKSSLHYSSRRSNKNTQFENLSAIQLYQNGSIQFLLPMIINVFKHLKQEINLQERYLDYPLVQSQQAFLKISKEALNIKPRCIDYINQDQQSQGSKYFLKRSVYSQNTHNTQNTNMNTERRAMMKQMDLLNPDLNQKVYEFINDHLYFYEKQNIYGNYVINYDVYFSNIIYGPEQDKNSPYFTLKITNIYANLNQDDAHASSIFNSQVVALNYQVESLTKQTKQSLGTQKTKYGQQLSYRGLQRQYDDFDDFQDNINEVKEEPESSESLQKKISDSEKNNINDNKNNNNNLQSNDNFDFSQSQIAVNLLQNNNGKDNKQKIGVENLGKQLQIPESQLMVDNLSDEKSPMAKKQDMYQNQNQKNDLNSTCLQDSTSRNLLGLSSINNPLITVRDEVEALQNQNSNENPRLLEYINESKQDGIQEEMTQNDLNSSLNSNKNSRKNEKNFNKQISQLENKTNKTNKKQNPYQSYLGEYAMTNNQIQKDGETSFQQPMISEHIMTTEQDNYVPLTMQDEQEEDIEKQTINSGGNSRGYSKKSILKQKSSPKGEQNYDQGEEDDIDQQLEQLDKIQINNLNNKDLYQNQEIQNQLEKMKKNSKKSLKNFLNNKKKKKKNKKDHNDSSITQNHGFQRGNQSLNILKQYFSKKNRYPKTVFILLNMKALYIVLFIVMIFIFQQELVGLLDLETTGIKNQHISYQLQYQYSQGFLAGLGLIYLKYDFLEGNYNNVDLEKELNQQLVESAQKYEEIIRKKEKNIYQIQDNNQGEEVQTQIYSIFKVESQEMQMTQFFNYISQEFLALKDQIDNNESINDQQFQNIINNYETHKELVKFISELYRKEVIQEGKQVFDSFLQFIIISTVIFIGVSMFFVPFIIQYKKYQEKILLLVTRIYEYEAEIEQRKIQQCVQKLESTGEQWIQESFIELTQQKSFEKLKNQKNKHQVLQGKIFQTSLSLNYQLVQLLLMTLSVTLFFAIITIISTIEQKKSDPVIELQYECQMDNFYINQLIFSSEMTIVKEDLFSQIPYFDDKLDKKNLQQQIEDSVQVLGNFFTQFEDILGDNYAVTSETQQQIKNGLKNSLCSLDICDSDMTKTERSFYENGLSGIMSYYLTNVQTYHDLIYDKIQDNTKKQELIKQYHNNDQHYYYIQQSYKVPFKAYSKLIDILLQDNINSISNVKYLCQYYLYIAGGVLVIMLFIFTIVSNKVIKQRVQQLHFLLNVIPYDKLQEESTLFMLKNICKF